MEISMRQGRIAAALLLSTFGFCSIATAQTLPAAPSTWVYSAASTISTGSQPTFTGWPTVVVPATPGVKHVLDCISVTIGTSQGYSGTYQMLQLEDGAAGSTILMRWPVVPTPNIQRIDLCGLNVVGTAGNAMTLRFTSGGATTTYNSSEYGAINVVGYDAQ